MTSEMLEIGPVAFTTITLLTALAVQFIFDGIGASGLLG